MTWPRPAWHRDADVVVVGSGAAGISAALTAAASGASVLVVTKDLTGGASPLAQGGLAAAIGPGDTASAHARDTEIAGVGLCEPDVVAALAAGSPGAVEWLVGRGAALERRALRLEGGHSANRVVHSGNDASGAEVHRALLEALLTSRVEIGDRTIALDLIPSPEPPAAGLPVSGLAAAVIGPGGELEPGLISARAVILAAGGLGQAYATTTNPPGATGDALAIAARAGAILRDPEFVQFHPTVLYLQDATGQCPLITEALRGAGAVLRDLDGKPLMGTGQDPRGDLAPRDVVAARAHEVIAASGAGHVWLDATALGADVLENGFPTVTTACRKHDIDPVTDLIPVAPGAHYSCGGIRADLDGRTSIPGLYAVGEAASTGVHGANRLASNSLVEAVIAARRAGSASTALPHHQHQPPSGYPHPPSGLDGTSAPLLGGRWHIGHVAMGVDGTSTTSLPLHGTRWHIDHLPSVLDGTLPPLLGGECDIESGWGELAGGRGALERRRVIASAMSRYAGVLRDAAGLERLVAIIEGTPGGPGRASYPGRPSHPGDPGGPAAAISLASVEAANLRIVSALIAAVALRRAESRGCHRRSDAPETAAAPRHTLARLSAPLGGSGRIHLDWEDL